jgi:UDP-glucose 4-epimerase
MKVLVTGGAGYIGSIVVAKLIENNYRVNVLDNLSTGQFSSVHNKAKFFNGSILNHDDIKKAIFDCEAVIHLAAKTIVSESESKQELYYQTNVLGTKNILDEMVETKVNKIIFSSTCAVYSAKSDPIAEESELGPTNYYAETKKICDDLIAQYTLQNSLNSTSFRFFNVAGSYFTKNRLWLEENHQPETHLIPSIVNSKQGKSFMIYGRDWQTKDGTCIRDYIHVQDLSNALVSVLKYKASKKHEIYNLGSNRGNSVLEVLEEFKKITGKEIKIQFTSRRVGDAPCLVANSNKIESEYGWAPKLMLENIIKSTLKDINYEF